MKEVLTVIGKVTYQKYKVRNALGVIKTISSSGVYSPGQMVFVNNGIVIGKVFDSNYQETVKV